MQRRQKFLSAKVVSLLLGLVCSPVWAQITQTWSEPISNIEFVKIASGCMQIGTDHPHTSQPGRRPRNPLSDEVPRHEVCVDDFWLGKFELSQGQWQQVMDPLASELKHPHRPKTKLTRKDAEQYLKELNKLTGDPYNSFRLPTEVEWEYACRAGVAATFNAELNDYNMWIRKRMAQESWFRDSKAENNRHEEDVGQLKANPWGLHDMLGNVMELVQDDYVEHGYRLHSKINPLVRADGIRYSLRGGSHKSNWWQLRCGARNYGLAGDRIPTAGMRVVKTILVQP